MTKESWLKVRRPPPPTRTLAVPLALAAFVSSTLFSSDLPVSAPMPAVASAAPVSVEPTTGGSTVEEAEAQALELEVAVEDIRAEQVALETRIQVTNERIFRQQDRLIEAGERLRVTRSTLAGRLVGIYKSHSLDPVSLLLASSSFSDFLSRTRLLARLAELDGLAMRDASVAAAEADYQAAVLDDLKAQEVELRVILRTREKALKEALTEQQALVSRLTKEALSRLQAVRVEATKSRQAWKDSSLPLSQPVATARAIVHPYEDRTYLVAAYQPREYTSTGQTYQAVCSWYGNEFHGRTTASGQIFNQEDLTCASRTLPFGTRLALTRGDRRVVVVVNDRGPFIAGRDLDLSRAAARALGFSGVERVHVEVVTAVADTSTAAR